MQLDLDNLLSEEHKQKISKSICDKVMEEIENTDFTNFVERIFDEFDVCYITDYIEGGNIAEHITEKLINLIKKSV